MTRGRGIVKNTVFDATSVASGGGTATSAAFSGIAGGTDMSVFVQVTGANGDIKVEVLVSEDGTNFVLPETGSVIITSITDTALHAKSIQIPVCSHYKLKLTNAGAGTVTVVAKVLSL